MSQWYTLGIHFCFPKASEKLTYDPSLANKKAPLPFFLLGARLLEEQQQLSYNSEATNLKAKKVTMAMEEMEMNAWITDDGDATTLGQPTSRPFEVRYLHIFIA